MKSRHLLASVFALTGACAAVACSSGSSSTGTTDTTPAAAAVNISESTLPSGLVKPTWAKDELLTGTVPDGQQIDVQVHLKLHNYQDAVNELYAVSDPSKSTYGQYLTNEQFASKYAATDDEVAIVRAHLEAHGLTVSGVGLANLYIQAHGTAAQVAATFSAKLGNYNVDGATRHAPMVNPTLPSNVLPHVAGVLGLSTSVALTPHKVSLGGIKQRSGKLSPADSTAAPTCSTWYGQSSFTPVPAYGDGFPAQIPNAPCGYIPGQVRAAYGLSDTVNKGNDGTGVTVAILDAYESPTLLTDAQTYFAHNDADHPLTSAQFKIVEVPPQLTDEPPVDPGWFGEQTLDVEAIHATAPGANIVFTSAASPYDQDLIASINTIVNNKLATMISNSYGSPEGQANDFVVWQQTVLQAGLKGVGVYFSSGDSGDESANLGFASADFPASLPHVTAVGGTSLALGQTGELLWETGWETGVSFLTNLNATGVSTDHHTDAGATDAGPPPANWQWDPPAPGLFYFGSGGGVSEVYAQPRYQRGVVPDAIATIPGVAARAVPDVGMLGDPITGYLIGETDPDTGVYSEEAIGGTSLACPLFVGTMALAEQHAKHALGFANTAIYKVRATAFRDITPPPSPEAAGLDNGQIITTMNVGGLAISTTAGWDQETGLGAPAGAAFVKAFK
jgi:subtilase family serine protease